MFPVTWTYSKMRFKIFNSPTSSCELERLFSRSSSILTKKRNRLKYETMEQLLQLQSADDFLNQIKKWTFISQRIHYHITILPYYHITISTILLPYLPYQPYLYYHILPYHYYHIYHITTISTIYLLPYYSTISTLPYYSDAAIIRRKNIT